MVVNSFYSAFPKISAIYCETGQERPEIMFQKSRDFILVIMLITQKIKYK